MTPIASQTAWALPHLATVAEMKGVVEYLSTEFSTSSQHSFPLIEFIDTPGLTDGTLKYPFDVNEACRASNPPRALCLSVR
jgi:hypothetical protein